jgi:hypothetical protein
MVNGTTQFALLHKRSTVQVLMNSALSCPAMAPPGRMPSGSEWDVVLVAEGTYSERIEFKGKNIRVSGANLLDSAVIRGTVIDASQLGSVGAFSRMEDKTRALSGFTIHNGKSENGAGIGGGLVFCDAIIENNVISWNAAADQGGGLHDCGGTIRNNAICFNSAANRSGGLDT